MCSVPNVGNPALVFDTMSLEIEGLLEKVISTTHPYPYLSGFNGNTLLLFPASEY